MPEGHAAQAKEGVPRADGSASRRQPATPHRGLSPGSAAARLDRFDLALLTFALAIYLVALVTGLTRFPIYFFCDEAIQANLAESVLRHGLRDGQGTLLPSYFQNVDKWNLSLSVYVQLLSGLTPTFLVRINLAR